MINFDCVYPVEPDPGGGWRVFGGAGGAGGTPRRSIPWISLGGGGWPDRFYAGGWIDHAGAQIAGVELWFANGITVRDDTEHDVTLFITDQRVACRLPQCCSTPRVGARQAPTRVAALDAGNRSSGKRCWIDKLAVQSVGLVRSGRSPVSSQCCAAAFASACESCSVPRP